MRKGQVLLVLTVLSNAVWMVASTYTVVTHTRDGVPHALWFFGFLVAAPLNLGMSIRRDRRRRARKYGTAEQPRLVPYDSARSRTADPWTAPPVGPAPPVGQE